MNEFELKFEIPPERFKKVEAAMLGPQAVRLHLQARYFDTPEGALAQAGIVVRLRKEGERWVQTAKGPTADVLERLEHNANLPLGRGNKAPMLDLSRHRGTPIGKLIDKSLGLKSTQGYPSLDLHYCTDVQRIIRRMMSGNSVVEVTLDQGRIFYKTQSQAVCEFEVELKEGLPLDALKLARQWRQAHGLWISTISKSMKGQRLCTDVAADGARLPKLPTSLEFNRHVNCQDMMKSVVMACLNQILPNMSELAWGSKSPEHIHQLRVGIRRLRTALRDLGDLTDAIDPTWEAELARIFRVLGTHRDNDQLARVLQPQWLLAGGPMLEFDSADPAMAALASTLIAPEMQETMLGLLAFVHGDGPRAFEKPGVLKKAISSRLSRLHRQVLRDGQKFADLDSAQRHRVRKRFKRLRYLMEFTAPLFSSCKARLMIEATRPVQDALGLYNDEIKALQTMNGLATIDPKAWFGLGWLAGRRERNAERCLRTIKSFAKIKSFW